MSTTGTQVVAEGQSYLIQFSVPGNSVDVVGGFGSGGVASALEGIDFEAARGRFNFGTIGGSISIELATFDDDLYEIVGDDYEGFTWSAAWGYDAVGEFWGVGGTGGIVKIDDSDDFPQYSIVPHDGSPTDTPTVSPGDTLHFHADHAADINSVFSGLGYYLEFRGVGPIPRFVYVPNYTQDVDLTIPSSILIPEGDSELPVTLSMTYLGATFTYDVIVKMSDCHINYDKPVQLPNGLSVPTYGKYGGPGYTGGTILRPGDSGDFSVEPVDVLDEQFRGHDAAYGQADSLPEPDKTKAKVLADIFLLSHIYQIRADELDACGHEYAAWATFAFVYQVSQQAPRVFKGSELESLGLTSNLPLWWAFANHELAVAGEVRQGHVIEGYVSGATVFVDTNDNGELDFGEASAVTDSNGQFTLIAPTGLAIGFGGAGPLIAIGGTDTSTGLGLRGQLAAPSGSTVVTPLTTLLSFMADGGKLVNDLVISNSTDLTTFDPIASLRMGNTEGAKVYAMGAKVMDTVLALSSALAGLGGNERLAQHDAFAIIAAALDHLASGQVLGLATSTTIASFFTTIAQNQNIDVTPFKMAVAAAIAASNAAIDQKLAQDGASEALLTDVSAIQRVIQANHQPSALDDSASATTGIGGTVERDVAHGVLTNDSDPDGDPLTVTGCTGGSHGNFVLSPDGSYSYSINDLSGPLGSHLHDVFTYGVSDGNGGVASATLDITLNRAPSAADDTATATTGIGGTASGNVLDNDGDPDGDTLAVTGFTGGSHGNLVLSPDGSYSYTVTDLTGPAGSHLHDIFTYGVSDGDGGVASGSLDITLNRAPSAVNDTATATTGIGGTASGNVLGNDSDPDGDALTVTNVTGGTHGTLVLGADGSFTYTVTNLTGPTGMHLHDLFTYGVSDGNGGAASATLDVDITLNRGPSAVNDLAGVQEGRFISTDRVHGVLSNDGDADGDALSVTAVSFGTHISTITPDHAATILGMHGVLTVRADGTYLYVADGEKSHGHNHAHDDSRSPGGWRSGDQGADQDTFAYTVADGHGGVASATLTITVFDQGEKYIGGTNGNDVLRGGNGREVLVGGDGNDTLVGGNGGDTLFGGAGSDVLKGGNGGDLLLGGFGNDSLYAGKGGDHLNGGTGDDLLNGGSGKDRFIVDPRFGHDTIVGFGESDVIALDRTLFSNFESMQSANAMKQVGSDIVITIDADDAITLSDVNLASLHANDFLFT